MRIKSIIQKGANRSDVGSLSLAKHLVALESEPSDSNCNALTHLATLHVFSKRPRCIMVLIIMMFFAKIRK